MPPETGTQKADVEVLSPAETARKRIDSGLKLVNMFMQSSSYNNRDNPSQIRVSQSIDVAMANLAMAEINLNNGNLGPLTAIIARVESDIKVAASEIVNSSSSDRNPAPRR